MMTPMVLDGPVNGIVFRAYVEQVPVTGCTSCRPRLDGRGQALQPGLQPHRERLRQAEPLLRQAAERSAAGLWAAIAAAVTAFSPKEYANHFAAPGYHCDPV